VIGPANASRLATVTPTLACAFLEVSQRFAVQFSGCMLGVAQGYRSPAIQQAANASGASPMNGVNSFSYHQNFPSLALDFSVLDPVAGYVIDGQDARYLWAAERFEEFGFRWGGRWKNPDWDHIEAAHVALPDKNGVQFSYAAWLRVISDAPWMKV
jgi:hypothetical protein